MNLLKNNIRELKKLTNKKVILKEEEFPSEMSLDKNILDNLAKRAFMMTLYRESVKQVYLGHFATLLQATLEKDPSKVNKIMKKYKIKILNLYENFAIEKDLLL